MTGSHSQSRAGWDQNPYFLACGPGRDLLCPWVSKGPGTSGHQELGANAQLSRGAKRSSQRPQGSHARVCTQKFTRLYNRVQALLHLAEQRGLYGQASQGCRGTLYAWKFSQLFFSAISFPSSPHKILPPMMDATPPGEGGRKENTKEKKNPLVKLGKPHGHVTWEKKASEVVGLPSSATQAVHCPTPRGDILMDYKIGSPLSRAVQGKGPA